MSIPFSKDTTLATPLNEFFKKGDDYVEFMVRVFTASEANGGVKKAFTDRFGKRKYKNEHWSERAKRHRLQKSIINSRLRMHRDFLRLPCHISFTRLAPRKLDKYDNLPMSLKYILDAICEVITQDFVPGRADSHEGFSVSYDQQTNSDYGVLIKITNL